MFFVQFSPSFHEIVHRNYDCLFKCWAFYSLSFFVRTRVVILARIGVFLSPMASCTFVLGIDSFGIFLLFISNTVVIWISNVIFFVGIYPEKDWRGTFFAGVFLVDSLKAITPLRNDSALFLGRASLCTGSASLVLLPFYYFFPQSPQNINFFQPAPSIFLI